MNSTASKPPLQAGRGSPTIFAESVRILVLSARNFTHLDNVVEVDDDTVTMTERPENLVFEG
jgi:hypothetical protein